MWCLGRYLPHIIGGLVPEGNQHWDCFIILLEIMDLLFSPTTSADGTAQLHLLIRTHHETFRELYPNRSITLKMHYLVHYPDWIDRYVPIGRLTDIVYYTYLLILVDRCGPISNL